MACRFVRYVAYFPLFIYLRSMKLRIALYLFLLATLCMGCGGPGHMRQLEQLEAQLDTAPDVVRLALDSIPLASLSNEERALYAILRTQADYKCYVPLTTDTLIRYATDYYNTNRKNCRAAMAWYSLGCVYTELSDDAAAIGAYLRAQILFPDTTMRYHALCYQNLGRHYLNREMYDDALQSLRSCKQQSIIHGDSSTVGYCDYYIGCAYLYQKSYDSAEVYFDKVLCNTMAPSECLIRLPLEKAKIAIYGRGDFHKALSLLHENESLTTDRNELGGNYSLRASVYETLQMHDSAYDYSIRASSCSHELHTQCWNYKRLAELSPLLGETDSTAYYISQYTFLLDSIYRLRQQSEVNAARNDFTIALYRQQQAKRNLIQWIIIIAAFLIAFMGTWLIYSKHRNALLRKNLLLDAELAQIRAALLYGISREDTEHDTASILTSEEIYSYYSRLYDACLQRYRQTASYTFMQPSQLHIDKQQRENVIADLKHCFADLISAVHSATPTLSADILLTCLCLSLGYSTDTITNLFVISPQTVRSRKSRAKKELSTPVFSLLCDIRP